MPLPSAAHALAARLHAALAAHWPAVDAAAPATPPSPPPPYRAAPAPPELKAGRAELIVEASDHAALAAALGSDADAVVLDFDDTFAPTPTNVAAAYGALPGALASPGAWLARPRALYARQPGLTFGGIPARAALCDLAALLTALPGRWPHLYLPKLETVAQAQAWALALRTAEAHLGLGPGTLRVCLQIETWPGLLAADRLLFELRDWAYGLNAGRWDYVFSVVKTVGPTWAGPLPPRSGLGMDVDAMRAYAEALVAVCRARGAQAVGGTAALSPDPHDPGPALAAVQADKAREAAQGFVGAWAGRPDLIGAVRAGLALGAPASSPVTPSPVTPARLLALPDPGPLDPAEVEDTAALALAVFRAWFAGQGVVERAGRLEDTATAELARALLGQWVRVQAPLQDGRPLTPGAYLALRRRLCPDLSPEARLLDHLVLSPTPPAYFPHEAQVLGLCGPGLRAPEAPLDRPPS
ncbi:aldolase/citrate lyase/malate synthase family protein [Deinococcus multiflagellatus]|uniref:aldolase/citrate lyase family protein n=1 Tax=Deinococcus multiflagellatus TaxID=1656887 RepID=UPI001CCF9D8F|nr:aldolase/citrate lyase family protein [Deinococcus multiflagellatus]MBZ9714998.1 malate synthase A [Deinococcus multiflagellatus]